MFKVSIILICIFCFLCNLYGLPDSEIETLVHIQTERYLNIMSQRDDWAEILLENVQKERENRLRLVCRPNQEECLNTVKNIRLFLSPWHDLYRQKRGTKETDQPNVKSNSVDDKLKLYSQTTVQLLTSKPSSLNYSKTAMKKFLSSTAATPSISHSTRIQSNFTSKSLLESQNSTTTVTQPPTSTSDPNYSISTKSQDSTSETVSSDDSLCDRNKFEDCKRKDYCFNNQPCTYVCILKEDVCLCKTGYTGKRCDLYDLKKLIDLAKNPDAMQPIKQDNIPEQIRSMVSATARYTLSSTKRRN